MKFMTSALGANKFCVNTVNIGAVLIRYFKQLNMQGDVEQESLYHNCETYGQMVRGFDLRFVMYLICIFSLKSFSTTRHITVKTDCQYNQGGLYQNLFSL